MKTDLFDFIFFKGFIFSRAIFIQEVLGPISSLKNSKIDEKTIFETVSQNEKAIFKKKIFTLEGWHRSYNIIEKLQSMQIIKQKSNEVLKIP